jgi:hypothetical protein
MRLLDGATLGLATQVPAVYPGQGYRCGAAESFEEAVLCPLRHMFDQKGPVPPPTASQANQYILPQPPEFCAWPEAGGDVLETLFQVTPTSTDLACVCYSSLPLSLTGVSSAPAVSAPYSTRVSEASLPW